MKPHIARALPPVMAYPGWGIWRSRAAHRAGEPPLALSYYFNTIWKMRIWE